jgi:spore germination cell wall hydrolase CwlJ-like protein
MNAGASWMVASRRSPARWLVPGLFMLIALALVTAGLFANVNRRDDLSHVRQLARTPAVRQQSLIAPLNLVKPLTPDQAIQENLERPFDSASDSPARQFNLRADSGTRDRALECLTQAVYYEAATENSDGQRAVAQVVLNRMRHPGFPPTVCGVVYQGSELPTGCQFTFTCDGSLAREPIPSVWARARKVAMDALAGHVFAPVGHATHYHADYVLPYWADSLAKQVQIGHHIFYRLKGGLGTDAAFSQRYAGKEPDLPPPPSAAAVAAQAVDQAQAQALLNSGLTGTPTPPRVAADEVGLAAAGEPKQVLLADTAKGGLLIDKDAAQVPAVRNKRRVDECPTEPSKRVVAERPQDLHAGVSRDGC